MTPDDKRHGTYAGAQAHRRHNIPDCEPCLEARRAYQRQLSYDHDRGRKRRVNPAPVATHVHALERAGISPTETARRAGVARATIYRAIGRGGYTQGSTIEATKAARILAVPIPPAPDAEQGYVPRVGVIRRIRALNAIGWPRTEIAARLGVSPQNLAQLVNGCRGVDVRPNAWVQATTWRAVANVYADLCMTEGPSARARLRAERFGWAPPLAWDNIDDPAERPKGVGNREWRAPDEVDPAVVERLLVGDRVWSTRAEKAEAVRRWVAAKRPEAELCRIHGWRQSRYKTPGEDAA